jgi:Predicted glycosyltransferases
MDSFLSAQYGVDFRVVVVDNASTDGSLEHLLVRYASNPRVKVLGLDRNHGFGGGIMKALELLGFPSGYLAFSNADLRVDPGVVSTHHGRLQAGRRGSGWTRGVLLP